VLDVLSNGMLGSLNCDKVLVLTISAFEHKPVNGLVSFVLVALDEVPSQNEVLRNVVYAITNQTHGNIVPGHSPVICLAEFVVAPILDSVEIHNAIVIEILAREHLVLNS
jgi:hypothetical protein